MRVNSGLQLVIVAFIGLGGMIRSAGIPPNELGALFQHDSTWDEAVQNFNRMVGNEDSSKRNYVRNDVASPSASAVRTQDEPSHIARTAASASLGSILVNMPRLTTKQRQEILENLYAKVYLSTRRVQPRAVLPLVKENLSAAQYQNLARGLSARGNGLGDTKRYIWPVDGTYYVIGRPAKGSDAFLELHDAKGSRWQNLYSIWRIEFHGDAKVWRYLGALEMPGHYASERFIKNHMHLMHVPHVGAMWPYTFFDDAAHLDPEQEWDALHLAQARISSGDVSSFAPPIESQIHNPYDAHIPLETHFAAHGSHEARTSLDAPLVPDARTRMSRR